jgi:hypothetical protein
MFDPTPPSLPDPEPGGRYPWYRHPVVLIFGGLLLLGVINQVFASGVLDEERTTFTTNTTITDAYGNRATSNGSQRDEYQAEYGGSSAVYSRIDRMTDCAALQAEFDTASANNYREEPGSASFQATLGYMRAADNRMEEVGCYE